MPGEYIPVRILIALLLTLIAWSADAATLLPGGKSCFYDSSGYPLADGSVQFYIPSTTTPRTTWRDARESTANLNPVPLDSAGCAIIYGIGTYREIVSDVSGNTIWDQLTTSSFINGISWGGNSYGTANAQVITTLDFTGADGQVIGFIAGMTNTGSSTLAIQSAAFSLGTYNQAATLVVKDSTSGPVLLTGGELNKGNVVEVAYSLSDGHFHLLGLASTGASGRVQFQSYTANSTWHKPGGLTSKSIAHLQCWGSGGGGGTSLTTGGGGGGGAYSDRWMTANSLGTTETVTISGPTPIGTTGGNSTFGSWLTAYGGGAGASTVGSGGGGGGGGGETIPDVVPDASGGSGGTGGSPWDATGGLPIQTIKPQNSFSGGGGGTSSNGYQNGGAGYYGGGGGGASIEGGNGGGSVWGGGGGAGPSASGNGAPGTSVWGGNGGNVGASGVAPGGGGGAFATGGQGRCQVTVYP